MVKKGFFVDKNTGLIYINKQATIEGNKITIRTSPRFKTYKEAFAEYEKLLNKKILINNYENDKSNTKLEKLIDDYIEDLKLLKTENTMLSIKKGLDYLNKYKDLSIKVLINNTEYFHKIRQEIIKNSNINSKTKNIRLSQIFNFFKRIKKYGYLSGEELDSIEIYFDRISEKQDLVNKEEKVMFFDLDTFKKMMSFLKKEDKYYVLFIFAFYTGLRIGEICGLKWKCVDFEENTITINSQYSNGKDIPLKSSSSYRTITVPNDVMNLLKDYYKYSKSVYVFDWLLKCGSIKVNYKLKTISKKINCKTNYTIHCFRHSHASYLYSLGANIKYISKRLGHKDVSTTYNVYVDLFKDKEQEMENLLNQNCCLA